MMIVPLLLGDLFINEWARLVALELGSKQEKKQNWTWPSLSSPALERTYCSDFHISTSFSMNMI